MIDDEVDDIPDDFIFVLAGAIAILVGFRSAAFGWSSTPRSYSLPRCLVTGPI